MRVEHKQIAVGALHASPTNPRTEFSQDKIQQLAASIEQSGLLEPLLVRPSGEGYEIVAGECRWRAVKALDWPKVWCTVAKMSDEEVLLAQLAENVVRANLNPIEESEGLGRLAGIGMDAGAMASSLGVAKRWVQERLALADLPAAGKTAVVAGKLSLGGARELLQLAADEREEAVQEVLEIGEVLSTERVRELVEARYLEPRRRREEWRAWWKDHAPQWEGKAEPVEDPETWADYVRPWGEGHGKWKAGEQQIGGLAARDAERGVQWVELARAHGILGLLVPVGYREAGDALRVVELVDSQMVLAAERAAREAGRPCTIGPKEKSAPDEEEDEEEELVEDAEVWTLPPIVERVREYQKRDEYVVVDRIETAVAMLDEYEPDWREDLAGRLEVSEDLDLDSYAEEEWGGWDAPAVWWILLGFGRPSRARLATLFGVRDLYDAAYGEGGAA